MWHFSVFCMSSAIKWFWIFWKVRNVANPNHLVKVGNIANEKCTTFCIKSAQHLLEQMIRAIVDQCKAVVENLKENINLIIVFFNIIYNSIL